MNKIKRLLTMLPFGVLVAVIITGLFIIATKARNPDHYEDVDY